VAIENERLETREKTVLLENARVSSMKTRNALHFSLLSLWMWVLLTCVSYVYSNAFLPFCRQFAYAWNAVHYHEEDCSLCSVHIFAYVEL